VCTAYRDDADPAEGTLEPLDTSCRGIGLGETKSVYRVESSATGSSEAEPFRELCLVMVDLPRIRILNQKFLCTSVVDT
jgi:hypothetical protein